MSSSIDKYKYAVDPRNLNKGDRLAYYSKNNAWTIVKKIDFICEGENCNIRHLAYVVRHRSEYQTWTVCDNQSFWANVMLLKDARRLSK